MLTPGYFSTAIKKNWAMAETTLQHTANAQY
jgi:hypothetical protein